MNPPSSPPDTVPGLLYWLVTHPVYVPAVVGALVVLYLGARILGYDLIPPMLAKLGVPTYRRGVNIAGEWTYECTAFQSDLRWGGECTIEQRATPYGLTWQLSGVRQWEAQPGALKVHLATPLPWGTEWGAFVDKNTVVFVYTLSKGEGEVKGYARATITVTDGRPSRLDGNFYQLPPFQALHGALKFERRPAA